MNSFYISMWVKARPRISWLSKETFDPFSHFMMTWNDYQRKKNCDHCSRCNIYQKHQWMRKVFCVSFWFDIVYHVHFCKWNHHDNGYERDMKHFNQVFIIDCGVPWYISFIVFVVITDSGIIDLVPWMRIPLNKVDGYKRNWLFFGIVVERLHFVFLSVVSFFNEVLHFCCNYGNETDHLKDKTAESNENRNAFDKRCSET